MTIHLLVGASRHSQGVMGRGRPHLLVIGVAVVVAVLWDDGTAASQPVRPTVVHGEVGPDGQSSQPDAWRVAHRSTGIYRIHLPGDRVRLDVVSWDAVADVTIVPLGHGTNEVRFSLDAQAVDTAFAFVAIAAR
jgi:hypothetical protein